MFHKLFKKEEHIDVEIYVDGRGRITTPTKPTFTQKALFKVFQKELAEGTFNGMRPGRYIFCFTETRRKMISYELNIVEDS